MKKCAFLILFLMLIPFELPAKETIKVGVYRDEPLVFIKSNGSPEGIYIDVLKYIASREGWDIEYVPGSWAQSLERLRNGEIDILPGVPYSEEKSAVYKFTNIALLSNWAQVYTKKSSGIESAADLNGKTIAGVKGDIYYEGFRFFIESFVLNCNFVELNDYESVFKFLDEKLADAGVVSGIYGMQYEKKYNIDKSSIICCPTELRFALSGGKNIDLIKGIDGRLLELKRDKTSVYYQSLNKWFGAAGSRAFPKWLIWILAPAGALLLVFLVLSRLLSQQVKDKTSELIAANEKLQAEISERKRVQEKLITTLSGMERRVEERTAELSTANELLKKEVSEHEHTAAELVRSNEELEQFAYVASHDLQEPLRMVTSYLQLLGRRYKEELDSDARDFIGYAVDGASRMHTLIENLLAYSRVGTHGKLFESVDCNVVIKRALENLKVVVEKSKAAVTSDPLPEVTADDTQLIELFQNLISNAVKFCGKGRPQIHISAKRGNGEWVFSVKDNGIGIDPQYFSRIFVIFQRLHTREEYPGAGVGLAICKKIVERHEGRMWVESRPGEGSVFFFAIPERGNRK